MRAPRRALCLLLALLAGCASVDPRPHGTLPADTVPRALELTHVPFFAQQQHQCGPAALATLLVDTGVELTPAELSGEVYLPGRRGSLQPELVAAMRRHGRLAYPVDGDLAALLAELRARRPVLVLQNLGLPAWPQWHYAVVVGYSVDDDTLLLRSGRKARLAMSTPAFLRSWEAAGRWAYVALVPGELPAAADPDLVVEAAADLESTGQPAAAAATYRAVLARWPAHTLARLGLGNSLHALGDSAGAERAYRALLATEPQHPVARNNLASVLAERGRYREARTQIALALAQHDMAPELRERLQHTATQIDTRNRDHNADDHNGDGGIKK